MNPKTELARLIVEKSKSLIAAYERAENVELVKVSTSDLTSTLLCDEVEFKVDGQELKLIIYTRVKS